MPRYNKKHYDDFATLFGSFPYQGEHWWMFYYAVMKLFEADNPRFNKERFKKTTEAITKQPRAAR